MKPLNPNKIGVFAPMDRNEGSESNDGNLWDSLDAKYDIFDMVNSKEDLEKNSIEK